MEKFAPWLSHELGINLAYKSVHKIVLDSISEEIITSIYEWDYITSAFLSATS